MRLDSLAAVCVPCSSAVCFDHFDRSGEPEGFSLLISYSFYVVGSLHPLVNSCLDTNRMSYQQPIKFLKTLLDVVSKK